MAASSRRKQAPVAEPGFIWSKSPGTVRQEFAGRMASGTHPEDVYRSIIGEINEHYADGQIGNRDAHRAANEAFGRLLMAKKKTAWTGWGPEQKPKRHKVGGWEWDNHLNGFVSNAPRQFECNCGEPVKVPDYHNCKCGKIWNTYVIGTGGNRHQASAEMFVAREIPNREGVIVAKRAATDHYHDGDGRYTGPVKGNGNAPISPYGKDDHCLECGAHFLDPHIGHEPDQIWAKRIARDDLTFPTNPHKNYSDALADSDDSEWPSDHHPSSGKRTMSDNPGTDWHSRGPGGKWTPGKNPGPNAFQKKDG